MARHDPDHVRAGRALRRVRRRFRHVRPEPAPHAPPSAVPIQGLRAGDRRRVLHLNRIVGSQIRFVGHQEAAGVRGCAKRRARGVLMTSENDSVALMPEQVTIPPGHSWNRFPMIGAGCALLGVIVCAILGAGNPKQFFFSWLVSFLFFLSLVIGALFFVLIQWASQGGWSVVLRRIGETTFATVPVMAALF